MKSTSASRLVHVDALRGLAALAALAVAWLLYRYVERPAMAWATRIRYSPPLPQSLASGGARA